MPRPPFIPHIGRTIALLALLPLLSSQVQAQAHVSTSGAPQQLAQTIADTIEKETFDGAFWGIHVINVRAGTPLYSKNPDQSFVPASNVKLLTTAAALDRLSSDYRYQTRMYADGPVEDGTLKGNLIIRGSGDPTIGGHEQEDDPTRVFRQWADSLKEIGVTHIEGNIIGDDTRLDPTPLGKGWSWSDLSYAYAAEIGGLVFNENTVDLHVRGREVGEPARITWEPFNTDYVRVVNRSRTVSHQRDDDEEYQRTIGTNTIHVRTKVHPRREETESITVTNPTLYFTHVLREVLLREGISVEGVPADRDETAIDVSYDADEMERVASYTSVPLSQIARTLNHESQNLYAEQLLRTLAVETPPKTNKDLDPGSSPLGIRAVRETLVSANVDTSRIQLVDGSGLSRQNLIRPRSMVRLLRYMWRHPEEDTRSAFYESLPMGGQEGTLEYRFGHQAPARSNVRAKTGTLSNMSSLSGYVTSKRGTPIAFAIFCNHHLAEADQVRSAQDVIINAIARLPL